ncbi:MAG: DUF3524 domain-containing protein [Persicimonas sp.]
MRILVLSAYDAGSHRRWHQQLRAGLGGHDWTVLTLPPRHFRWRIRGNALSWAFEQRETLERDYDIVLATSMVDLSALRGLVPRLARARNIIYFHENQFAYPASNAQSGNAGPSVVNLYAALSADRVVFNSRYNLESFLAGATDFLELMPDHAPLEAVAQIRERASVIPVPLADELFAKEPVKSGARPLSLVWNHRWEYDKAPDRFFEALFGLSERGLGFELHVLGQQFRSHPEIFDEASSRLSGYIATWGFVEDRGAYQKILREADVVVSTALHEFQGLAMLEAIASGCRPLAPDRLAYREYVPEMWRYASFPDEPACEIDALTERLAEACAQPKQFRETAPVDVGAYAWSELAPAYRELLERRD